MSAFASLLIGTAFGAVVTNILSSQMLSCFTDDTGSFYLTAFLTTNVNFKTLFAETVKTRLEVLAVLVMITFTRYKRMFFNAYMFVIGICGGLVISINTMYYMQSEHFTANYIGIMVYVASIMPHYIMYIFAIILMYRFCIKREVSLKTTAVCILISVLLIIMGAVCEAGLSPGLIRFVLNRMINFLELSANLT